ncbi:MAG: NAD-dependent protein deacetylase [Rhodoferax sp.]|nr:NAD-dependent protein deacetylase [Rhodoferax sp.]HQX57706.1 NAD-dependent protein deacetylase [Burkholderiaceae bacterium]HRA64168.1 NAD-dependent protein deacetylase [Burkholderiaceae bacterium]
MPMLTPLIEFVRRHPRLLVLTGAGCSTQAGIADYRDADGAWKRSAPMRYQLFVGDDVSRRRYWARSMVGWRTMAHARPTDAHHALVRLEGSGHVRLLVTQNVDGLHDKAGSKAVIDLHGRIDTVCCLACGQRSARGHLQQQLIGRNPSWATLDALSAPDGDADLEGLDFAQFDVPDCQACGGMLKPDVVFFGENVPRERVADVRAALAESDAVLVAGSSLMVYSGLRFVEDAVAAGKPVAAVNIGRTRADPVLSLKLECEVGVALQALASDLALAI